MEGRGPEALTPYAGQVPFIPPGFDFLKKDDDPCLTSSYILSSSVALTFIGESISRFISSGEAGKLTAC